MSKKTVKYTKGEIGKIRIIPDFLPPPEMLVMCESTVKVTLSLSESSVEYFKAEAARHRVPYKRMIRALVDQYASAASAASVKKRPSAKTAVKKA